MSLNEDFEHAVDLVTDLVKNSTFDEFDKEKAKLQGELIAELDSPRQKVMDGFTKNIFEGHSYGTSSTTILENLQNVTKEQVVEAYQNLYNNATKVITFVGDASKIYMDKIIEVFPNAKFASDNLNCLNSYSLGVAGLMHYNSNIDIGDVLPLYLKKPQAQRQLEEKENLSK